VSSPGLVKVAKRCIATAFKASLGFCFVPPAPNY